MVTAAMKSRHLLPGKKSRQHIKKQRHYFADKGPSSQSFVFFPVVMYGCESWTIKKAECQKIDASNCGAGEDS